MRPRTPEYDLKFHGTFHGAVGIDNTQSRVLERFTVDELENTLKEMSVA
jgi:hypothetical protein